MIAKISQQVGETLTFHSNDDENIDTFKELSITGTGNTSETLDLNKSGSNVAEADVMEISLYITNNKLFNGACIDSDAEVFVIGMLQEKLYCEKVGDQITPKRYKK